MNLPARSVRSNGSLIRQLRLNRGWTQLELAKLAGYSARLIRKLESSNLVDIETVKNIAEALSTTDESVAHFQLTLANLPVEKNWIGIDDQTRGEAQSKSASERAIQSQMDAVRTFVQCYDASAKDIGERCKSYFAPDLVFHCPADPENVPFAGDWHGVEGVQKFFDVFYSLFSRQVNTLTPEYMLSEKRIVARFMDQVFFQGHALPPHWVNLHFQFRDGLIVRIDDEFDHYNAKKALDELMARLAENGCEPATNCD